MTPAEIETIHLSLAVTAKALGVVAGIIVPWLVWGIKLGFAGRDRR